MVRTAYNNDMPVSLSGPGSQLLDSGNERAGRIDNLRSRFFQFLLDLRRYTMCANNCGFTSADLHGFADRRDTIFPKPLHLLVIMDERPEASDGFTLFQSPFDHLDSPLDAKTKPVFIC
jgi:hypothetical protein